LLVSVVSISPSGITSNLIVIPYWLLRPNAARAADLAALAMAYKSFI